MWEEVLNDIRWSPAMEVFNGVDIISTWTESIQACCPSVPHDLGGQAWGVVHCPQRQPVQESKKVWYSGRWWEPSEVRGAPVQGEFLLRVTGFSTFPGVALAMFISFQPWSNRYAPDVHGQKNFHQRDLSACLLHLCCLILLVSQGKSWEIFRLHGQILNFEKGCKLGRVY